MASNNKRAPIQDTLHRHWEMLKLIPTDPRKITTSTLSEKLQARSYITSSRTIQRDLNKLQSHFPLLCDDQHGRPFGWSWSAKADPFSIPHMSAITALTILILQEHAQHVMPPAVLAPMRSQLKLAKETLKRDGKRGGRAGLWRNKVQVAPRRLTQIAPVVDKNILATVYQALDDGKILNVIYRKRGDNKWHAYLLYPQGLVVADNRLVLLAVKGVSKNGQGGTIDNTIDITAADEVRQFMLHRMESAKLVQGDPRTKKVVGFSLNQYIKSGRLAYGLPASNTGRANNWRHPTEQQLLKIRLTFFRDAGVPVIEAPISDDQRVLKQSIDSTTIEASVSNTVLLHEWILGFGELLRVDKPLSLKKQIAARLRAALRQYK